MLNPNTNELVSTPEIPEEYKEDGMSCDSVLVDLQSANVLKQVYDVLKPNLQKKFITMPIVKATKLAWSCVKK